MLPPDACASNTRSAVASRFVHSCFNKDRSAVLAGAWTPDGRRFISASNVGMFTLWSGFSFSIETSQQAHDAALTALSYTRGGEYLVTGGEGGEIRYWQVTLNNVKEFSAHAAAVRTISFCPTDAKFATGSDDATVKVWDFERGAMERLLPGEGIDPGKSHRWDVRCVEWHPRAALVLSASKDHSCKLWDPRAPREAAVLHQHKGSVQEARWHPTGNHFASGGRDQVVKIFDVRTMREAATFKGHQREVTSLAWHPFQHELLASGDSGGSVFYWSTLREDRQMGVSASPGHQRAHEQAVLGLRWHPLGHLLASFSQDSTLKFWSRVRPDEGKRPRDEEVQVSEEDVARALKKVQVQQARHSAAANAPQGQAALPGGQHAAQLQLQGAGTVGGRPQLNATTLAALSAISGLKGPGQ